MFVLCGWEAALVCAAAVSVLAVWLEPDDVAQELILFAVDSVGWCSPELA